MKNELLVIPSNLEILLVAGDIHGDLNSFNEIRKIWEKEKNSGLIFLGDYADRGEYGIEVIEGVMELNKRKNVFALKGNHEEYNPMGEPSFRPCDLPREVETKKGVSWRDYYSKELRSFFNNLYISAIIKGEILFVHGGISSKISCLEDLKDPSSAIEEDILWSDPWVDPFKDGKDESNDRGSGILFVPKTTNHVLNILGVKYIIRSHEPRKARDGPYLEHDNKVITTSATSVYGERPFVLRIPTRGFDANAINQYVIYLD